MNKILIAYYSRRGENYVNGHIRNLEKGNTEIVAEKIKQLLPSADLFHIDTVQAYSPDYTTCTEEAKAELDAKARPELTDKVANMDEYDTIVLGYPNWWGTMPMAVYTFLESYDFSGKTIVPFCTNEGSGMGFSEQAIAEEAPRAILQKGTSIHGSNAAVADREVKAIADKTTL